MKIIIYATLAYPGCLGDFADRYLGYFFVSKRVLSASSIFSYFSEFGLVECGIVDPLILVTFILIYIITIHMILP